MSHPTQNELAGLANIDNVSFTTYRHEQSDEYHISRSIDLLKADSFINSYKKYQNMVWITINGDTHCGRYFNYAILIIVALTVILFILSTEDAVYANLGFQITYYVLDYFCVLLFTVEYITRLWSCTSEKSKYYKEYGTFFGRIMFSVSLLSIIDLLTIVPMYVAIIIRFSVGSNYLHKLVSLRLLRLFRLFKADRYLNSFHIIVKVIYDKRKELITSFFVQFLFIAFISSILWICEGQQEAFSSIIRCMYWVVISLSTVKGCSPSWGRPQTIPGHLIEVILGLCCFGAFAVPTSILGAGFLEEHSKMMEEKRKTREAHRKAAREKKQKRRKTRKLELQEYGMVDDGTSYSMVDDGSGGGGGSDTARENQVRRRRLRNKKKGNNLRRIGQARNISQTDENSLMINASMSSLVFFCPHCKESSEVRLNLL